MARARAVILVVCLVFLAGAVVGLGGCSTAYRQIGLFGKTMFSGGLPALAITPTAQLTPVAQGRTGGFLETDTNLSAAARLNYAIFGDTAQSQADKPFAVKRHGHVLISELTNNYSWEYSIESSPQHHEVYLRAVKRNGLDWTEHLLFVNSAGDWFSEFWQNNGSTVPQQWIGKRWSRDYAGYVRVLAEYREPMPACIEVTNNSGQSYFVHAIFNTYTEQCQRELRDFEARADEAFDIQNLRSVPEEDRVEPGAATASVFTKMPEQYPDMKKLVGQAQVISRGGHGNDFND